MKIDVLKINDLYLKAFKYISLNSKSNTLPYHNMEHLMLVFNSAYSASNYYQLNEVLHSKAEEELCIASLFHDVNHSGGKLTDSENVANSIESFKSFWVEYNDGEVGKEETEFQENVISIIESTQFPHKDVELNIQQKIIRDCDMMSFNTDNHIYHYLFGMKEEFGVDDFKDQILNQTKFIMNIKLYTEWGRDRFSNKYGKILNDLNFLRNVFNDGSLKKETPEDLEIQTIKNENGDRVHPYTKEIIKDGLRQD